MLFGELIRAPSGASATFFSPWFPRQGTKAYFACNLIASGGVSSFEITVETKKTENDNTTTTTVDVTGGATTISTTADSITLIERGQLLDGSATNQGFFDLVRFKYVLTSNASARAWAQFRMLKPTWETY